MAKDKCEIGYSCGEACIAKSKECIGNASLNGTKAANGFANLVSLAQLESSSKILGQGDHGKAFFTPKGTVVKALISDEANEVSAFENEAKGLKLFGDMGIAPKLISTGKLADGKRYIEMEYLQGYRTAAAPPDGEVKMSDGQHNKIQKALEAMHKAGYAHNDMYALNTIVNDELDDAKLIDFGFMTRSSNSLAVLADLEYYEKALNGRWPDESPQGKALAEIEDMEDFSDFSDFEQEAAREAIIDKYLLSLKR